MLLGRKKRGFGAGMIMGLGGKTEPGESDAACAIREAGEEARITVDPAGVTWRAELSFVFPAQPELDAVVTVFFGERWAGEPQESDELVPAWFEVTSLPLDQMWDDEQYWLPRVLAGETLSGVITYGDDCQRVAHTELTAAAAPKG